MVLGERAVHDAEEPSAVPTGVLAAPHRPGAEGTHPEELAGQFEPSAQAIRNWVRQADRDDGRRQDGLTTASRMSCAGCGRESNPPGRAGDPKKTLIAGIHRESRGMYGAPRIHAELTAQGDPQGGAGGLTKCDPSLHPDFTQEVAPNESQTGPKPLTSEALIHDVLFVAHWLVS
jgi:transposase